LGPQKEREVNLMSEAGVPLKNILSGKMRRYFSLKNFTDFFKIPLGLIQSLWHLLVFMPDAIFSKGGYASLPVVLAGWIYQIPILIHESDSVPGMTNSFLGKFANRVAVSYPQAETYFPPAQVVLTGNPVRNDVTQGDREKIKRRFSLSDLKKTILVIGGSQGSQRINEKILEIIPDLLKKYQVIHQTGLVHLAEAQKRAGELGIKTGYDDYHPLASYKSEELKDLLAVADLVISRAGANSLSEIAANGKPAIVIPIENSANNHQKMNAYSLAKVAACVVLEENNLGKNILLRNIDELMENQTLRDKMTQAIKVFYHPDAAERIAQGVLEIA
jgi:UDP-N-acetylglucosamine--N-acetylmuramyl-(pentapeptide) pyrophosphoryl-undecaprenol N-acetylglucosamine transferase